MGEAEYSIHRIWNLQAFVVFDINGPYSTTTYYNSDNSTAKFYLQANQESKLIGIEDITGSLTFEKEKLPLDINIKNSEIFHNTLDVEFEL